MYFVLRFCLLPFLVCYERENHSNSTYTVLRRRKIPFSLKSIYLCWLRSLRPYVVEIAGRFKISKGIVSFFTYDPVLNDVDGTFNFYFLTLLSYSPFHRVLTCMTLSKEGLLSTYSFSLFLFVHLSYRRNHSSIQSIFYLLFHSS